MSLRSLTEIGVRRMRMAELSAESGVPVATVKYYLREGLLPPGERTSPNQARYDATHVQRLKLVRALREVGGLSLAAVGEVLKAVDGSKTTHNALGIALDALSPEPAEVSAEDHAWARGLLERLAERHGWKLHDDDRTEQNVIDVLCRIRDLGHDELIARLDEYADLAQKLAVVDLGITIGLPTLERIVEAAVVGSVLGDRLFAGLRRFAQERESRRLFQPGYRSGDDC
ncbi:MerR family transcriptional regulator [Amycolatopsis sp. NPDC059027]|uniref:MerR family transcriptional regulator n=1 Tax=unclassified Amycolatopsis TaxID=2618356 RepID=UPI00367159B9